VWNKVGLPWVQQSLREAFTHWGLPGLLRLDNGYPWGHRAELPTALALWLVGLGVAVHFNPPRQPQDNGVVEKSHGTSTNWVEPQECPSVEALQDALWESDRLQREEYPLAGGKTRRELFAELGQKRRGYVREQEAQQWQEPLAQSYLGQALASRWVSSQGKVSVYARNYQLGLQHRGKKVFVQFDAESREWLFTDRQGVRLCKHPAEQVTRERLLGLSISAKASKNRVQEQPGGTDAAEGKGEASEGRA
jgi:hypothetical protein